MDTSLKRIIVALIMLLSLQMHAQPKKWTLEECIEYAIKNNISIKLSELDERTAGVSRSDARGAFLPSANGQASHSWNIGLNQNITTGLLENQTTQFTSVGLNVGIDLYNGLQNQNRLRRANLAIIAAQYQLTQIKEDVALNVANAYLQILFNRENLKVQRQQLVYDNQQLKRVQELVDAGSVPRGDLLDINATVATDNQRVIAAENALLISKLSLAQLMQLEDFQTFDISDNDYAVTESSVMLQGPSAIYDKAKQERTELKLAQANVEVAQKDITIAKGAYQPTLQGFYSFNTRAAYSDRVIGAEEDLANPTSVVGFLGGDVNQPVLTQNYRPILGSAAPIWEQFNDNKGHSFGLSLNEIGRAHV